VGIVWKTGQSKRIMNARILLGLFTFRLPERQDCELETRLPLPLGGEGGPHRRFHQPGRDG